MARIDAWTMEQDDLLAAEWGMWPDEVVAQWLGRTRKACETRAQMLGIGKQENRKRQGATGRESVRERGRYVGPETRRGWYRRGASGRRAA